MSHALAIVSTALGVLGTLSLLILCVASAPNSSPAQAAQLKLWAIVATLGGLAALGGAIALLVFGRPWSAAIIGVLPMAALFVLMIWASVRS